MISSLDDRRPSNSRPLVQLRRSRDDQLPFVSRARYIRNLDNGAIPGWEFRASAYSACLRRQSSHGGSSEVTNPPPASNEGTYHRARVILPCTAEDRGGESGMDLVATSHDELLPTFAV